MSLQRLVCVRHGRPTARYPRGVLITSGAMNDAIDAYDRAGLDPSAHPPPARLLPFFAVSSDLERAVETAMLLTGRSRAEIVVSPSYREVPLPRFRRRDLRLPASLFFVVLRAGWLTGAMPAAEPFPQTMLRVRRAADELERLFEEHDEIALFSHGLFLWLLGRELQRRGFTRPSVWPYGFLEQRVIERRRLPPRHPDADRSGRE
jgi:broad specificity phosphatase PhoE